MSKSITRLRQLKLPVSIAQVGSEGGAFFSDPLTQTLKAVTGTGSTQGSPNIQYINSQTQNVNSKDTDFQISEHPNTNLQTLDLHQSTKIEVCDIINDSKKISSKQTIQTNFVVSEASQTSDSKSFANQEQDQAIIQSKFFRRNYRQPQVMRFCPLLSSSDVDISVSGFTARAKQGLSTAKTNMVFNEGVHYWEITCPIRCSSIFATYIEMSALAFLDVSSGTLSLTLQLIQYIINLVIGVSQKGKDTHLNFQNKNNQKEPKNLVVQAFRTSTSRVIGIELDLIRLKLRYWIDGKPLHEMQKDVPAGKAWIPTVLIKEPGLEVILNPFCVSSDPLFSSGMVLRGSKDQTEEKKRCGQRTFPSCLSDSISSLQCSFLSSQMDNYLIAFNFQLDEQESAADQLEMQERLQVEQILKKIVQFNKDKQDASLDSKPHDLKEESKNTQEEEKTQSEEKILKGSDDKKEDNIIKKQNDETDKSNQNIPEFEVLKIQRPFNKSLEEIKMQNPSQINTDLKPEFTIAAFLKFKDEQEALKFLVTAKKQKSSIGLLSSADIALLLDPRNQKEQKGGNQSSESEQNINYKPYKHLQLVEGFDILVPQLFRMLKNSNLISETEKDLILKYSSLREICSEIKINEAQRQQQFELDPEEKSYLFKESDINNLLKKLQDPTFLKNEKSDKAQQISLSNEKQHIQSIYLPNSDKVVLSQGNKLKLISRTAEQNNNGEFLSDQVSKLFDNQIENVEDQIFLNVNLEDMKTIGDTLDQSLIDKNNHIYVQSFLQAIIQKEPGNNHYDILIKVTYLDALFAVKSMLRAAVLQYKKLEDQAKILEAIDLCQNELDEAQQESVNSTQLKNIIDVNKLLSILVKIEEQLYQLMSQSEKISERARKILFSKDLSRIHTAYGRLFTLIQLPCYSQNNPLTLAELGVCNLADGNTSEGLRYYQQTQVDLENISENLVDPQNTDQEDYQNREIRAALQSQLKGDLFFDGFETWNVPLSHSLNSMPARTHQNGIKINQLNSQDKNYLRQCDSEITSLQALNQTDFIMSSCKNNASVNIWSTKAGLTQISEFNFKIQAFIDPKENMNRAQIQFLQYSLKEQENGIKVYQKQNNILIVNQIDQNDNDQEKGEGELMQAMFDDSEAINGFIIAEENQYLGNVEDIQAENDEELENLFKDYSMIEDIYAACDLAEDSAENDSELNAQKKLLANLKEQVQVVSKKQVDKIQVPKEKKKAEKSSEGEFEPNKEFYQTLIEMGFSHGVSKLALQKVKNEGLPAAVEAAVSFQAEEIQMKGPPKQLLKKVAKREWQCLTCTLLNKEGTSICDICQSVVPEEACTSPEEEQLKKDAEELRKQMEKEKIEKQLQEQEEKRLKLELKIQQEQELKAKIKNQFVETRKYFENSQVKDFFFGSINEGKNISPLFVGCLFQNQDLKLTDFHFKALTYRKKYLSNFIYYKDNSSSKSMYENRLTKEVFESEELCIQSLFENHKDLLESFYPALGQHEDFSLKSNKFLQSQDIGTVRLPLVEVEWCVQINENLKIEQNGGFILKGTKEDGSKSLIYVRISLKQQNGSLFVSIPELEAHELSHDFFEGVEIQNIKNTFKISLQSNQTHLIIHHSDNIDLFKLDFDQKQESQIQSEQKQIIAKNVENLIKTSGKIIKIERNNILIEEQGQAELQLLQLNYYQENDIQKEIKERSEEQKQNQIELKEKEYMQNQKIDPSQISIKEIQQFEDLMKGKALSSISNSNNTIKGLPMERKLNGKSLLRRHNWIATDSQYESFGPLEVQFESLSNLISLNLDLTFSQKYGESSQISSIQQNINLNDIQLESSSLIEPSYEIKNDEAVNSLGQFTVKLLQNNSQESSMLNSQSFQISNQIKKTQSQTQQEISTAVNYLPLMVQKHKGAQFNDKQQVGNLVLDNTEAFASNYPRPEFFFKHAQGHQMRIDKITVKSWHSARSGANPVGSGLVFIADSMESFERTGPFLKFTGEDYQKWKAKRVLDPRPLRPYEPVAFFELDEGQSITVEVDIKKFCRYIMLKPTGLRKKPHPYKSKHVDGHPMELVFFGVQGFSQPYNLLSDHLDYNSHEIKSQVSSDCLQSGYAITISDLYSRKELLTINSVEIQQVFGGNTPTDTFKTLNYKKLSPIGQALQKITNERISQQPLKGLSLTIKKTDPQSKWDIRGISMIGVVTTFTSQLPPLFRSYLMDPQYFEFVNNVLAQMTLSNQWSKQLTAYIMQFLVKIVRHDSRFINLIVDSINIHQFIYKNILTEDHNHIQTSLDFIKSLASNSKFVRNLYEVLIEILVNELPTFIPPRKGYDAIMGMFNWIMPLDINRSLVTLIDTFYKKVCMSQIKLLQTPESITFRTRCSILLSNVQSPALNFLSHYPFDEALISDSNQVQRFDQQQNNPQQNLFNENNIFPSQKQDSQYNLIRDVIIYFEKSYQSTNAMQYKFKAYFNQNANVQQIKIHFKEQKSGYHKLEVLIIHDEKIISSHALKESQLARYARPQNPNSLQKDDKKLLQSNQDVSLDINVQCPPCKELTVKLIFSQTATSITPPESIIEFYGKQVENIDHQKSFEQYQQQIEIFQKQQASLLRIGNSIHMISVPIQIQSKISASHIQGQKMMPFFIQKKQEIDSSKKQDQLEILEPGNEVYKFIKMLESPIKENVNEQENNQILQKVIDQAEIVQLKSLQQQLKEMIQKGKILYKPQEKSQWTEQIEAKALQASLLVRIREIQDKISQQNQFVQQDISKFKACNSQQYLVTYAVDLSKLLGIGLKQSKLTKQSIDLLLQQAEPFSESPIVDVSFNLFKHFVAFEQGPARIYVLTLIKDHFWQLMDSQQRTQFFSKIAIEFLSKPQTMFSQRSTVDALDNLKIPSGDLIHFLSNSIDLQIQNGAQAEQQKNQFEQPFVLISSILFLSLQQLTRQEKQNAKKDESQQKKEIVNKVLHMVKMKALELARQCKKVYDTIMLQKNTAIIQIVGKTLNQNENSKDQINSQTQSNEQQESQISDDDLLENLEPLGLKRSFSVPIKNMQKNVTNGLTIQARILQTPVNIDEADNLKGNIDEDEQFLNVFKLAVRICRMPQSQLSIKDKRTLLIQVIENLNGLQKQLKTVSTFAQILQIGSSDFLEICVAILCIQDQKLLKGLETLLQNISQPHLIQQIQACVSSLEKENLKGSEAGVGTKRELYEMSELLKEEQKISNLFLKTWTHQLQGLLIWIIDRQRQQRPNENIIQDQNYLRNQSQYQQLSQLSQIYNQNEQIWMEHLTYLMKSFITYKQNLQDYEISQKAQNQKDSSKVADQGLKDQIQSKKLQQGLSDKDSENDLEPLKLSKSLSLPIQASKNQYLQNIIKTLSPDEASIQLIRSLMSLLLEQQHSDHNTGKKANQDQKLSKSDEQNQISQQFRGLQQQHLPQIWSLILKLFSSVSISKLIEAKMLDHLIKEFLRAPNDIQSSMYSDILKLAEQIINQKANGKNNGMLIANLIFYTLKTSIQNEKIENICFCLCEGWNDILIFGNAINGPFTQQQIDAQYDNKVYVKMSVVELSTFLRKTSNYLIQHLNYGNFEGSTGSQKQIVMRLQVVHGLLSIAFNAKLKENENISAIKQLEILVQSNQQLKQEYQKSIDQIITWLFLNARSSTEEISQNFLGNVSLNTPATLKVKKITEIIESYLMKLGSDVQEYEAVKVALRSLVKVVQQFNTTLMEKATQGCIPIDYLIILSFRSNQYFTKFVGNWLKSDSIASHFVFQLRGFELLLDTIGNNADDKNLQYIDQRTVKNEELTNIAQFEESDISDIFQQDESEQVPPLLFQNLMQSNLQIGKDKIPEQTLENLANPILTQPCKPTQINASSILTGDDQPFLGTVQELASKNLLLIDNQGNAMHQYSKMDWACNKKCYKNRLIFSALTSNLRFEYILLFQLQQTSLIKEIQVGFTNFWTVDQEVQVIPLSIVIQGGLEKDNLTTVCTLDILQDDGFASVQATVFGKNMHSFQIQEKNPKEILKSVEDIIKNKLGSLNNFQANYIQLSMRRHILCCLENSPIAARQSKKPVFAINYISLIGNKLPEPIHILNQKARNFIIAEQKKTALEVLSKICSGNFLSVLRIISNQQRTIDKIKSQFDLLASLASIKSSLIEPTFITIAKYNKDMGDWMIKKFLTSKNFEKHASLTANLVMCERQEIPSRLQMLQEYLMDEIENRELSSYDQIKSLLSAFQVFNQTIRICAPLLTLHKRIDLAVQSQIILKIVDLASVIESNEEQFQDLKVIRQFAIILLCPPSPFVNSKSDCISFSKILMNPANEYQTKTVQRQTILGIIASTNSEISLKVYEYKIMLSQLTFDANYYQGADLDIKYKQLENALNFWTCVSQEINVKFLLQKDRLPFQLYQMLRVQKNEQNGILSKFPDFLIQNIVELIKSLVAGYSILEDELANLLVEDLEKLSEQKEENFINFVFIPLIKIEYTLPVTLGVYRAEKQEEIDIFQEIKQNTEQSQINSSQESFLQTELLNQTQKTYLKQAFKEIVQPKSSDAYVSKFFNQKWAKVHQWDQSSGESPSNMENFGLWKQLEGKGPCIVLTSGKTLSGQQTVFGGFWQGKVPQISNKDQMEKESMYDNLFSTIKIQPKDGDFCFCYSGTQNNTHFVSEELPLAQIFLENEDEGAAGLTIGSSHFMLITYSGLEKCFGDTVGLQEVKISGIPKVENSFVPSDLIVEFTEIWALEQSNELNLNNQSQQLDLDFEETRLAQLQTIENKHPWTQIGSPYSIYRSSPVYMVPAHLTVYNVCKIILKREIDSGNSTIFSQISNIQDISSMTIKDLYDKFCEDQKQAEENMFILDLKYDRVKVLQAKEIESLKRFDLSKSFDSEALQEQIATMYIPQMSFFNHFQEKGGVSKIISVTLQTVKTQSSGELAKNISLWLNELFSFSQIPLFFQLFLKNQKCKNLLFDVLAGKPDQEFKANPLKKEIWDKIIENAVQFNYTILSEVFQVSHGVELREKAIECGLLPKVLERLSNVSGEKPRVYKFENEIIENEQGQELNDIASVIVEEPKNTEKKKRKGVGYSSKQGQAFDVTAYLENAKQRNEQIKSLVDICSNFLCSKEWQASENVANIILESSLLPLLEQAFRNGSCLDMAKSAEVYSSYLSLTRQLSTHSKLVVCLLKIDPHYKPPQKDEIFKLLGKLNELAKIFLGCLSQVQQKGDNSSDSAERPEKLARDIIETYNVVSEQLEDYLKNEQNDKFIENALALPLAQQYRALLEDLRFDYMNMKDPNVSAANKNGSQDYIHHYKALATQNENPPASKMIRLAQEFADLSNALPCEHTNSIFVRVDKSRVDLMKALIVGSCNTPYAHGCFEFDLFCDNKYPNDSPKMNLMTTGNGSVRFNPNLYACGKVCLSLLGTWRGSANENWDPKLSTILQVLVSVQAIIMAEEVYFNEPGFENEAGTVEGEKKNEGYANIVRFANVKFAMLGQLKNPSKGFESVIKRHFYVKRFEILKEVHHWIELANKNEAAYTGLVNDHNDHWCSQFKQTKTKYREMLTDVVNQLEDTLNKLEKPSDISNILPQPKQQSNAAQNRQKKLKQISEGQAVLEDIDVGDDNQIDSSSKNDKVLNIDDEAVKDRWSRYIGAMGVEAVAKQAAASIFLSGAGALGIEIAKNIVLSGCKKFTLHDPKPVSLKDLSGQFFINQETDFKKNLTRSQVSLPRLQSLNFYVRCNLAENEAIPLQNYEEILSKDPWNLHTYDVIIATEQDHETLNVLNQFCYKRNIKFISADCVGIFSRVFNDFGDNFEVLDKNGEDLLDVVITNITNEEQGIVQLLHNQKHKLEDGDEVLIQDVKGMKLLQDCSHDDPLIKSDSINETVHKVQVLTPYSFKIGNTLKFDKYQSGGVAKQLRTKLKLKFKRFDEAINVLDESKIPLDQNLAIADFEKMHHNQISHLCYLTLDAFKKENDMRMPNPWNIEDATNFIKIAQKLTEKYSIYKDELFQEDSETLRLLLLFSFQCKGVFNPLCAFIGGIVAQECIKAITQKFSPTFQLFYYDTSEVLPEFNVKQNIEIKKIQENDQQIGQNNIESIKFQNEYLQQTVANLEMVDRYDGLRIILGQPIVEKLANTNLFMVGAGAIGCELLKNFAMLGIGRAKKDQNQRGGSIVLTDPDIIEVSNLNRQFLFREKHLRNPKSSTAAAAAIQMNKDLKGNVIARLDKVHEGTQHIFTDQFFEGLTIVTNALDNVAARKYVDLRCVSAKIPLLESGTLGPKGHVQVILPHLTESYNSQKDPEDNNEIPICTLKMFPEETIHCIEWARDLFGKLFTQGPKSALKILDEANQNDSQNSVGQLTSQQDIQAFKEGLNLLKQRPKTFEDCIQFSRQQFEKYFSHDIQQLLHVYPLDAKTKEGTLFWTLPKRPPFPLQFDKDNILHQQLITSMSCLMAKIFCIEIPSNTPRTDEFRKKVAHTAAFFKVPDFIPDEGATKEIIQDLSKAAQKQDNKEEEKQEEEQDKKPKDEDIDVLKKDFLQIFIQIGKLQGKDASYENKIIRSEEFEKDVDSNFHIDFMHAMGNCRAINYKLEPMDWIQVKLKAGRIVPAMATTTASIAGLQTLELVKYIRNVKKVDHRNAFLNLAVPFIQASEPGDVQKSKFTDKLETTLWDRWELTEKQLTLKQIMEKFEQKYEGLEIKDILKGNTPLFFRALVNVPGKEKEKEQILQKTVAELLEINLEEYQKEMQDQYVDLTITCIMKGDQEEKMLDGIPLLRIQLY